jgi:hypothetical protein
MSAKLAEAPPSVDPAAAAPSGFLSVEPHATEKATSAPAIRMFIFFISI